MGPHRNLMPGMALWAPDHLTKRWDTTVSQHAPQPLLIMRGGTAASPRGPCAGASSSILTKFPTVCLVAECKLSVFLLTLARSGVVSDLGGEGPLSHRISPI